MSFSVSFNGFHVVLRSDGHAVAGEVLCRGFDHRGAERQLQLPVDHQSAQQTQPDRNVGIEGERGEGGRSGVPDHRLLDCAEVKSVTKHKQK